MKVDVTIFFYPRSRINSNSLVYLAIIRSRFHGSSVQHRSISPIRIEARSCKSI